MLAKLSLTDLFTAARVNTSLRDGSNLLRYQWHVFDPPERRPLYDEWQLHSVDARATRCIAGVQAIVDPFDWKDILVKYAGKTRVAIDVSTSEFTNIFMLLGHDEPYIVEVNDVAINIFFLDERLRAYYIYPQGFKAECAALRGDDRLVVLGAFEDDWDEAQPDVLRVAQLVCALKPSSRLRLAADDSGGSRGGGGG